jgi:4-hydroxybenzoate polyprenyltransferase
VGNLFSTSAFRNPARLVLAAVDLTGSMAIVTNGTDGQSGSVAGGILRLLRPHQWVKNLLVFAPLVLSHRPEDTHRIDEAVWAFALFCLVASAGYAFNDWRDVEADRHHPEKRRRPLASGAVPVAWVLPLALGLLAVAFAISILRLPRAFTASLAAYVLATLLYSVWLKSRPLVDVLLLAGLYTLRILAGGAATGIALTPWLLAFSMFLFLSLAFAKRHAELAHAEDDAGHLKARGYRRDDIELIETVGITSGYLAVLVVAIYINDPLAATLYRHPLLLWLICPILLYWITRIWLFARRRALHQDPILFALRDPVSWITALLITTLAATAALLP